MAASFPTSVKTWTPLIEHVDQAVVAQVNTVYEEVTAVETALRGDSGKRVVEVALNGSVNLAVTDIAYFRVPAVMNGWNLVAVAAMCKANTTGPTITVKNGATSMLTTAITIDNGEFDTLTAAIPPVIDTAHDDVATGAQIEVKCSVAGTGVTYAVVELQFQAP